MYHKLVISALLILTLLLPSSPAQSQITPPISPIVHPVTPIVFDPTSSAAQAERQRAWENSQLPDDQMPICPPIVGLADTSGPPNFDKPACRALNNGPSVSWKPGTAPPAGFVPASKMGPVGPSELPADATPIPPTDTPIPVPTIKSSSIQSDPYFSWATNNLDCASSCAAVQHVTSVYWIGNTNVPTLACCGHNWAGYHYSVRTHIASSQTLGACTAGEYGNMAIGVGYGQSGPQTGGVRIFWEDYGGINPCLQFWDTQYTFPTNAALYFALVETYESNHYFWSGFVWIGGGWVRFFHNQALAYADIISQGIELEANNGDKSTVLVPLAFAHKATLTTAGGAVPWDNPTLPAYLQGKTTAIADVPWNVLDSSGSNYTSVAAQTTFQ